MTSEYTVAQLKDMLLEAQIASQEPLIQERKRQEQEIKDAIDERGIPELHDIWAGRKTANETDIVREHDPNHGHTKNLWQQHKNFMTKQKLVLI